MRAAALGLAALLAGCATAPKPIPRPGPAPAPAELMAALEKRHAAVRTMEMETRTTSWLGGDRIRATVLMMVDRSGRLRFEAEVPLKAAVATLVVQGGQFTLLDLEQKVVRKGRACPQNVASLIRIPLLPEEIAAILLGDAPLGPGARPKEVLWDDERGADVLAIERPAAGEAATRLWVTLRRGGSGYEVLAVEGESPQAPGRWRVSYEKLTVAGGVTLPDLVRYAEPGQGFDEGVEIKVNDRFGLNRPLRDDAFTVATPPGYPVEIVPCDGRR